MLHWIIGLGAPAALVWHIAARTGHTVDGDQHLFATGNPKRNSQEETTFMQHGKPDPQFHDPQFQGCCEE